MKQRATTVTINGRLYDAITGRPIASVNAAKNTEHQHKSAKVFSDIGPSQNPARNTGAHNIHSRPQKSQTLRREILSKPVADKQGDVSTRSPLISKFGSKQSNEAIIKAESTPTQNAEASVQASESKSQPTSKELKEQLIKERMAEINTNKPQKVRRNFFKSNSRITSILTASLALLVLGGYLTYLNLPNISMRVAATRAGIAASFPNYTPDGYRVDGPITYSPGEVAINYRSNTNPAGFTLTQKASNWDSQAVLDNYVNKQTQTYLTYQERGITVYTFGNKAVWVNGGLLYTLDGDAGLGSDQVLRLANSL